QPARFGERPALPANFNDMINLDAIKSIHRAPAIIADEIAKLLFRVTRPRICPRISQPFDFLLDNLNRDAAAEGQRCHASHSGIQIAEVPFPRGARSERELEKLLSRLF